jgi:hypothetical protein
MGKVDQKVITMLDIDRVLSEQEISLVESSSEKISHKTDQPIKGKNQQGK